MRVLATFRVAVFVAAATVASSLAPVSAAPRVTISGAFTASGFAGSQAKVRVSGPMSLPDGLPGGADEPVFTLTASAGQVAGVALAPTGRSGDVAFLVQSTQAWSCGSGGCGRDSRLAWGGFARTLPKGDYVLVLIGAPGARITVTVAPKAKGPRPVRVPLTHRATPVVTATEDLKSGLGIDPVASGRAAPPDLPGRVLLGIVHTMSFDARSAEVRLRTGRRQGIAGDCWGGLYASTNRAPAHPDPDGRPIHRTQAVFGEQPEGAGVPCAEWEATTRSVRTTHAAVAVQVPIAF